MNSLIFDRTLADVEQANAKGQYNASDLNRVEEWCEYLAETLTLYDYPISITTKTNWTQFDKREETEMERIRLNIRAIMLGFTYITNIYPTANSFDYIKANNWEQILWEISMMLLSMQNYQVYSGVSNSGQKRFWQNRFRIHNPSYDKIWSSLSYEYWSDISLNMTWQELVEEQEV